jgi:hypothetical protein
MNAAESGPSDVVASALLNALREVTGHTDGIVEDERSRETVAAAYRAATDDDCRAQVDRALEAPSEATDTLEAAALRTAVEATYRRLRDEHVRLRFTHETSVELETRDVALYSFLRTEDPAALERLDVGAAVGDGLTAGADALSDGAVGEAREAFRAATDAADTTDERVSARVLAAWARHRAGDREAALPLVTEALERDATAWPARVVGTIADHGSPSLFEEGKLAVRPYLRVRADVADVGAIRAAVRPRTPAGDWQSLSGPLGCLRIPDAAFGGHLDVRLRLSGPLDDFPSLYAYYVAVGLVDERNDVPRNVLYQPLQGPETTTAVETLRFES